MIYQAYLDALRRAAMSVGASVQDAPYTTLDAFEREVKAGART